ncbi:MAG: hypothetical protein JKY48_15785, partial [Flavobacteriales bacterium]|nr:hypothetical protein [Flavobacteriales bacterium]
MNTPLLDLNLENYIENKLVDDTEVSPSSSAAIVHGASFEEDETFGSVLSFDGKKDSLQVPTPTGTIAISLWVNLAEPNSFEQYQILVGEGSFWFGNYWAKKVKSLFVNGEKVVDESKWHAIPKKTWAHLYIEATSTLRGNLMLMCQYAKTTNIQHKVRGKLSRLRLYDTVLSQDEIQTQIASDRSYMSTYRALHPIDFDLWNDKDEKNLIIKDDGTGVDLTVEIRNTSSTDIELNVPKAVKGVNDTPDENNYHFALHFRPGILKYKKKNTKSTAGNQLLLIVVMSSSDRSTNSWSTVAELRPDNSVKIWINSKQNITINKEDSFEFILSNLIANPGYGSRGTQVELQYKGFAYAGKANVLSGLQVTFLEVLSHIGLENIPLHVGFVGSNTVLNDGHTSNSLSLRITNTHPVHSIKFSRDSDQISQFIFRIVGENDTPQSVLTDTINGINLGMNIIKLLNKEELKALNTKCDLEFKMDKYLPDYYNDSSYGITPGMLVNDQIDNVNGIKEIAIRSFETELVADKKMGLVTEFHQGYIELQMVQNIQSISMWLKLDDLQSRAMDGFSPDPLLAMCFNMPTGNEGEEIDITKTAYYFGYSGKEQNHYKMYIDGVLTSKSLEKIPQKNQWVHIYIEAKKAFSGNLYLMGDINPKYKLSGRLSDVRLYNAPLTIEEIGSLSRFGIPLPLYSPKASTSGTITASSNDQSKNGRWAFQLTEGLRPGDYIDVKITGIVTNKPTGLSNFYVDYENIPGYYEAYPFVALIEKSPILSRLVNVAPNNSEPIFKNLVAIGTNEPKNKLDVEGAMAIGAAYSGTNTAPENGLLVEGNVGIGTSNPQVKLGVEGNLNAIDVTFSGDLIAAKGTFNGDVNIGGDGNKVLKSRHINGKKANSADDGGLYLNWDTKTDVHVGGATSAANLIVNGKIGVGSNITDAKLEIGGNEQYTLQAVLARGGRDPAFQFVVKNGFEDGHSGSEISRMGSYHRKDGTNNWLTGFRFLRGDNSSTGSMVIDAQGTEVISINGAFGNDGAV